VVDAGGKVDFWRLERIVGREMDGEEKYTARIWTIALLKYEGGVKHHEVRGEISSHNLATLTKRATVHLRVP